ncbi:MAG: hypothetical protein AAF467_14625 [Actinomycetota bacterium]
MQAQYGDQVQIIGVPGLTSNVESIEAFIAENDVDVIPHLDDGSGEVWDRFGVTEQRTYVFVNDDGTLRITGYGALEAEVERLIAS